MSKLVIVESPAKAKNIKGYLGKGYDVVASMGHVRDLPAARLSVDIAHDFAPKYAVIAGKENFVKDLKKKAQAADYVYLATDPDREGEAISWHLATLLGLDMKEKNRVTFNEITKHGVLTGMEHPRAIDIDFVNAQQARRILDRLIGYKLSPFISQKIRRGLSAGRVQSVALRLVVDREEEIRAFKPEEYWSIDAKFTNPPERKSFAAALAGKVDDKAKIKITSKEESDKILSDLEGAEYMVQSVKKGTRKKSPTPPFITSTLQQEASRRLSFQAKHFHRILHKTETYALGLERAFRRTSGQSGGRQVIPIGNHSRHIGQHQLVRHQMGIRPGGLQIHPFVARVGCGNSSLQVVSLFQIVQAQCPLERKFQAGILAEGKAAH